MIARIYHVRDILHQRLNNPPAMMELVQLVSLSDACGGLRLRKLQRGFRELFGTTVFGYLHHHRMEQAQILLRYRDMQVSEVGLVYQPSDSVSLYASYSRSFNTTGTDFNGEAFEPSRGTQYEVGVKTDFLEGKLLTTLSAYHLTKTNIATLDPDNPDFTILTGEQRSQGIELDVGGEILPGWKAIARSFRCNAKSGP